MSKPYVSIVMRSMNDIKFIERTLDSVMSQDFKDFELVNIDSGSTDGTFDVVKRFNPAKSKQIRPEEYIPGKVLNSAVKSCSGEIVVFNNSDCIPLNNKWLQNLIEPFARNEKTGATFANQLPRPDATPLVARDSLRAYGDGSISAKWPHFFSLASSAAPKKILEEIPFDETIKYSEDIEWSLRIKKLGWQIAYVPSSEVEHSHNYTPAELRKRFYNEGLAEGRIYGSGACFAKGFCQPMLSAAARDVAFLLKLGKVSCIPTGLRYRFIQKYYAYKGRKDYFRGK